MRLMKNIVSWLLISIYVIGFAHNIIPHKHNSCENVVYECNHLELHDHTDLNEKKGDEIRHRNHLDEGLLDFLVCFLSEMEHLDFHDKHEISQSFNGADLTNNQFSPVYFKNINSLLLSFIQQSNNQTKNYPFQSVKVDSSALKATPYRGPPTLA